MDRDHSRPRFRHRSLPPEEGHIYFDVFRRRRRQQRAVLAVPAEQCGATNHSVNIKLRAGTDRREAARMRFDVRARHHPRATPAAPLWQSHRASVTRPSFSTANLLAPLRERARRPDGARSGSVRRRRQRLMTTTTATRRGCKSRDGSVGYENAGFYESLENRVREARDDDDDDEKRRAVK